MARRQTFGFEPFSRRDREPAFSSLLGDPPMSNYEDRFDRNGSARQEENPFNRRIAEDEAFGRGNFNGRQQMNDPSADFFSRSGQWQNQRRRSPSPSFSRRADGRRPSPSMPWANRGFEAPKQLMRPTQEQQVVMVLPQGQGGQGNIIGMMPMGGGGNSFGGMQRPGQQMQVILGNLPAFSSEAFARQQQQNRDFGYGQQGNMDAPFERINRVSRMGNPPIRRPEGFKNNNQPNRISRNFSSPAVNRTLRKRYDYRPFTEDDKKRGKSLADRNRIAGRGGPAKKPKTPTNATPKKKEDVEAAVPEAGTEEPAKDEEVKVGGVEGEEKKKSKYEEIPAAALVCHVCEKTMTDGAAFESHLSGRPHLALIKILETRFQKRTELLMLEGKLSEEEIGIELDRQRKGKATGKSKTYCKMCSCNYFMNWGMHKQSLPHRVLKEFLHPTCVECGKNFVHRMDWVAHLVSPDHLKKLVELEMNVVPSHEELFVIRVEYSHEDRPINSLSIRNLNPLGPDRESLKELLTIVEIPEPIEPPPEFVQGNSYGESAFVSVTGWSCKVCKMYISRKEDADEHCKTIRHHTSYSNHIKRVIKAKEVVIAAEAAALKAAEEKRAAEEKKAADAVAAAAAEAKKVAEGTVHVVETLEEDVEMKEEGADEGKDAAKEELKTDNDVQIIEKKPEEKKVVAVPDENGAEKMNNEEKSATEATAEEKSAEKPGTEGEKSVDEADKPAEDKPAEEVIKPEEVKKTAPAVAATKANQNNVAKRSPRGRGFNARGGRGVGGRGSPQQQGGRGGNRGGRGTPRGPFRGGRFTRPAYKR